MSHDSEPELSLSAPEREELEIVSENLSYWTRAARSIARNEHDALDLVQQTLLQLFELRRAGKGPDHNSNIRAYVTAMMRNAHYSQLRSPQARVVGVESLELLESSTALHEIDDIAIVDLADDVAKLRTALTTIAPDQRDVLVAVTVEGLKPRNLVDRFDRPAPAISNLLARAKISLRRALLLEYLAEGGIECEKHAQALPVKVELGPDQQPAGNPGVEHARGCEKCRKNWRRFAEASTLLALLPASFLLPSGAAPMVESASAEALPGGDQASAQLVAGAESAGTAPLATVSGLVPKIVAALASKITIGVGVVSLGVAGAVLVSQSIASRGADDDETSSKIVTQGDVKVVTPDGEAQAADRIAHYDAALDVDSDGVLRSMSANFSLENDAEWELDHFSLSLPDGVSLSAASNGLTCSSSGQVYVCVPGADTDLRQAFDFSLEGAEDAGALTLDIAASGEQNRFVGEARGIW